MPEPALPPLIRLRPGKDRRIRDGYPWVFANELAIDAAARAIPPGAPVRLADARGQAFAVAGFNVHSLIAARLLSRDPAARIDRAFIEARIREARGWRDRLVGGTHYRLVHAEADGLPGLVVDRYGDVLVVQANTATADRLLPDVAAVLQDVLAPRAIIARNDSAARHQEGLPTGVELLAGEAPGLVPIEENGLTYLADPMGGQKTGWFFDLREPRALIGRLARPGQRMLDVYCHTGAFALLGAKAGAEVLAIDRSKPALDLAAAAERAGLGPACRFERRDAAEAFERLAKAGALFDIVVVDPPSFAKTRKDLPAGLAAHRRLAETAARRVAAGGLLFIACCAHHIPPADFLAATASGISAAMRDSRLVASGGAGPDHPVHPLLPESAYLKWHLFALA